MSIKHLQHLKVKDSKLLVVEIRPVRCLLDSPSGPVYTHKWMERPHWKELDHMLRDIVDEYEEEKAAQGVTLNRPKCKTGQLIQMGYMYRHTPSCECSKYFLAPSRPYADTQDGDGDSTKLHDKGGRFTSVVMCAEMLVTSVILQEPSRGQEEAALSQHSSSHLQHAHLSKLVKALDSEMEYITSISDYFSPSRHKRSLPALKSTQLQTSTSHSQSKEPENKGSSSSSIVSQDAHSSHSDGSASTAAPPCTTVAENNTPMCLCAAWRRGREWEETDDDDDNVLFNRDGARKRKKDFRCFGHCNDRTPVVVKEENCSYWSGTESGNVCGDGVSGVRDEDMQEVSARADLKTNSETPTVESDRESMRERKPVPGRDVPAVPCEADQSCDFFTEVKLEIQSFSENELFECRSDGDRSGSGDYSHEPYVPLVSSAAQGNVECDVQVVNWLAPNAVGSGEGGRVYHVHSAILPEQVMEQDVEGRASGSTGYCISSPVTPGESLTAVISPDTAQRLLGMTEQSSAETWFTQTVEAEITVETKESEPSGCSEMTPVQQRDVSKRERKRCRKHSSIPECIQAGVTYSSEAVEGPFLNAELEDEAVETVLSAEDDAVQQQDQGNVLFSYQEEPEVQNELKEDFYSASVEEHVPQEIHLNTKVTQEFLVQEGLSQISNYVENSVAGIEICSVDGYSLTSSNSADIQCFEVRPQVAQDANDGHSIPQKRHKEAHPPRKLLKSLEGSWQVTRPSVDNEDYEGTVAPEAECRDAAWHGTEHNGAVSVVEAFADLSENSETGQEVECIATNSGYLSAAEGPMIAENEVFHPLQVFENLHAGIQVGKHTPEVLLVEESELPSTQVWNIPDAMDKSVASVCVSLEGSSEESDAESSEVIACSSSTGVSIQKHAGVCLQEHAGVCLQEHAGVSLQEHAGVCVEEHAGASLQEHAGVCVQEEAGVHAPSLQDKVSRQSISYGAEEVLSDQERAKNRKTATKPPEPQKSLQSVMEKTQDKVVGTSRSQNIDYEIRNVEQIKEEKEELSQTYVDYSKDRVPEPPCEGSHSNPLPAPQCGNTRAGVQADVSFHASTDDEFKVRSTPLKAMKKRKRKVVNPNSLPNTVVCPARRESPSAKESCKPDNSTRDSTDRNPQESVQSFACSTPSKGCNALEDVTHGSEQESSDTEHTMSHRRSLRIRGKTRVNFSEVSPSEGTESERESSPPNKHVKTASKGGNTKETSVKSRSSPVKQRHRTEDRHSDQQNSRKKEKNKYNTKTSARGKPSESSCSKRVEDKQKTKKKQATQKCLFKKSQTPSTITRGNKKNAKKSPTASTQGKEKDTSEPKGKSLLKCSEDEIDDDFYRMIQAETKRLTEIENEVEAIDASQKAANSSLVEEEEDADAIQRLSALRASFRRLHEMTENELEQRLDENIPYLEQVIQGTVPNERHQMYKKSSPQLRRLQDHIIYGPFTAELSLFLLDLLKEKLRHMEDFIGCGYDLLVYRVRVLVPTLYTKIVMDNENVTLEEAHRLLNIFSLDRNVAYDLP